MWNDDDGDEEECDDEEECELGWDTLIPQVDPSASRLRLEMEWELNEAAEYCNVKEPQSCGSEPCQECCGKGWMTCRFCRGTSILYLPPHGIAHDHDFFRVRPVNKVTNVVIPVKGLDG